MKARKVVEETLLSGSSLLPSGTSSGVISVTWVDGVVVNQMSPFISLV